MERSKSHVGLNEVIVAGGVESMSLAPFYIRNARYGVGTGNNVLVDSNTESQLRSQPIEEYGQSNDGLNGGKLSRTIWYFSRRAG